MVYVKKVNIKGQDYWYLFHTIRKDNKFLKKSKYLGKELPKNIEDIKKEFLYQINNPKEKTEIEKLIEGLTPLERKVLPSLKEENELNQISNKLKLKSIEVLRAFGWLEEKNILRINKEEKEVIDLDKNGLIYLKEGLPEKQFLKLLPNSLDNLRKNLSNEEINVAIGILKRNNAINFGKQITITEQGKKLLKELQYELFLKKLPINISKLNQDELKIYEELKTRKDIIKKEIKKIIKIKLSSLGKEIINHKLKTNLIESLNQEMLIKKTWKNKTFRRFNISSEVPKKYPGRRHFVNEAIQKGRKIWLEMGFKEMKGKKIVSSFWNFDALFTAQDHPVRDLHDTFFIKDVQESLPDKKIVENVKLAHEKGVGGSAGWNYKWDEKLARKSLIRTHTTCLSSQTLAKLKKENIPAKFFAIGKCFRNETADWKHGFEFNQTEGIVVDPNANLRNLIWYLREFAKKMGFDKIKIQPSYFPYTEPSIEGYVWNEQKKQWIEVLAAGIFRPEVTIPLLGIAMPVLAWGPGFDRLMMAAYEIIDLREVYANDLKKLRTRKTWI
jgi:phenylalanyl-tRNA synthetase alpha chain